jgi:hypothetical protein
MGVVHHFLHIYFFTEFEIFFYFYYILPYEKQTVYDMFTKNKLLQYDDEEIFIHSNISSIENQCAAEDERINANHDELWSYCCAYVIFINTTLFLVFVRDFIQCYRGFSLLPRTDSTRVLTSIESNHKKTDSDFEFEMVDLEAAPTPTTVVVVVPFKLYYWENSEFVAATCKIIQFIVLIGVFEYLFFSFIINKYKIVSGKMVLCKLLKKY